VVSQLNRGIGLVESQDEKERIAELNLLAGQRAKAATAYASALTYLAVGRGLLYFRHLGIDWSPHPTEDEARREYEQIWERLGSREIEALIDLPLMTDPTSLATMDVQAKIAAPVFFTDVNLSSLLACKTVNLSLEHGNCDASCVGYVRVGMIAGSLFDDYQTGFRLGRLGCTLVEQRDLKRLPASTYHLFGAHVVIWTRHIRAARDPLRRAFETANKTGDVTYAGYSYGQIIANLLHAGDPLIEVQRDAEYGLALVQKARLGLVVAPARAVLRLFSETEF